MKVDGLKDAGDLKIDLNSRVCECKPKSVWNEIKFPNGLWFCKRCNGEIKVRAKHN